MLLVSYGVGREGSVLPTVSFLQQEVMDKGNRCWYNADNYVFLFFVPFFSAHL